VSDNTPHQKRSDHPHVHHIQNQLRTSPAVLSMQPCTRVASKFSYLLFCNPTHKTETGILNRWGTTTNRQPPGPIIMILQSETLRSSQIIFVTLFCSVAQRCCAFHQPRQTFAIMLSQNAFPELNRHILTFLHPILLCRITHRDHRWRCS
jgi:hypothetical protein